MDNLHQIKLVCTEFLTGIAHNLLEKSKIENWRTSIHNEKVFLTFDTWQAMGESNLTMAHKPGTRNDPYAPIENSMFICRGTYINKQYPLRRHTIKVCLTGLKYKVIPSDVLFVYNEENDFSLDSEKMPLSWGNPISIPPPPTDNIKGWVLYFTNAPYDIVWAENTIQRLITEVHSYSQPIESGNIEENQSEKALNELRKLLG
jgi:hypothetical protein